MTLTPTLPDEAVSAAEARHALVLGLTDLAVWLETHPDAPAPTPVLNIPVGGKTRGEKLAELDAIAEALGTDVEPGTFGMLIARRSFGGAAVEAHVAAEDTARRIVAAQDAARAGSAVAA